MLDWMKAYADKRKSHIENHARPLAGARLCSEPRPRGSGLVPIRVYIYETENRANAGLCELGLSSARGSGQFVLLLQLIGEENDSRVRPTKACLVRAIAKPEPGAQIRLSSHDIIFFFDSP